VFILFYLKIIYSLAVRYFGFLNGIGQLADKYKFLLELSIEKEEEEGREKRKREIRVLFFLIPLGTKPSSYWKRSRERMGDCQCYMLCVAVCCVVLCTSVLRGLYAVEQQTQQRKRKRNLLVLHKTKKTLTWYFCFLSTNTASHCLFLYLASNRLHDLYLKYLVIYGRLKRRA
jgi:hypothetical protein